MIGNWRAFLDSAMAEEELTKLRHHSRTGRPLRDSGERSVNARQGEAGDWVRRRWGAGNFARRNLWSP